MITCSKCNRADVSFYVRKRGARAGEPYTVCKDCMKARGREYYRNNTSEFRQQVAARSAARKIERAALFMLLKGAPCADCEKQFQPWQMDFDHRDPTTKIADVSALAANASMEVLLLEISKCDLVCANCHRTRTQKSWNSYVKAQEYLDQHRAELEAEVERLNSSIGRAPP